MGQSETPTLAAPKPPQRRLTPRRKKPLTLKAIWHNVVRDLRAWGAK